MSEAPESAMDWDGPPLRVVLADDEPVAREVLVELLRAEPGMELVAVCSDGVEALSAVRSLGPDVVFLDVQMPGMDGLTVLTELSEDDRPAVVLATAHAEYAVRAFDEQAVDYLLKPFDDVRFRQALERVKQFVRRRREGGDTSADVDAGESPSRLTIHRESGIEVVAVEEVRWIQSADQYVRLHTAKGEILMRESMAELERKLDTADFLRVHRSALVALREVVRLESRSRGGRLLLRDGTWIPVSRSRIPQVRKRLG